MSFKTLPRLSNIQIDKLFSSNPLYLGCYAKDELLHLPIQNKFAIINNNNASEPDTGTGHWTLVYNCDPKLGILFDSMGAFPSDTIVKWIKRSNKKLVYSNQQVQELYGSESCGWFCMYVALQLLHGRSYADIMQHDFTKNLKLNEERLSVFFHNI